MPYSNEFANKSSHSDIVKNPDIRAFLEECEYIREPSPAEAEQISSLFKSVPDIDRSDLPSNIFAMDGSVYESLIDDKMPSTKVGYVKVSTIHISLDEFGALRVEDGRFVDPFRVASLRRNKDSLLFILPGTNMKWKGQESVRDSFRAKVDAALLQKETWFDKNDYKTSLRSTLFHLASLRPDESKKDESKETDPNWINLHKCPSCQFKGTDGKGIKLEDVESVQHCPSCDKELYPSDTLRLWEEVNDHLSNMVAMTRFMLAVEHMLPVHYIRHLRKLNFPLEQISSLAFFVDGPLAVFGTCAWISRPLMRYYEELNQELCEAGHPNITVLGLQKTGQLSDYFNIINKYVPGGSVYAVEDTYRYKYVIASRDPSKTGFGDETYYGQDFLYKTTSERNFVVSVPYPFTRKGIHPEGNFHTLKTESKRYSNLDRTLALIKSFETDLYTNAVVPIALAHRYTAISAQPGGKVLDILSKSAFGKNS